MRRVRPHLLLHLGVLASYNGLSAQCPDGSAPPCRRLAPSVVADANVLVILPFEVTGAAADVAWLGEGMVDLLSASLDGFAGWRVVSPRTVLARTRQARDLRDVAQAADLARSLGAGGVVLGRAVVVGAQLRLRAELYETPRHRRLAAVEARGPVADPGPLADRLAVGLARHRLANQRPGHHSPVREFATSSPDALRAYLAAEQLARRGALQAAADSLQAAITHDSAFGLAYSRLMIVSAFGTAVNVAVPTTEALVGSALRHVNRLPPRQRDILLASAALWEGRRADALRLADALGQRYPDDADAAYVQGEAYVHFGMTMGGSPLMALEPLQRAIRLDPELLDAYIHVIEAHCLLGDTTAAWALLDRALAAAPRSIVFIALRTAMAAALRHEDPLSIERGLRGPDGPTGPALVRASIEARRILDGDPARAIQVADSFVQLAAAPDQPFSVRASALRLHALFLTAQGRYRHAWEASREAASLEPTSVPLLAFITVLPMISGSHLEEGRAALDQLSSADPAPAALVIAAWSALEQGDSSRYTRAIRALDSLTAGRVTRAYTERRLSGLRGLLSLQQGDTVLARQQLERAHDATSWLGGFVETAPDAYFALRLARLERAAGALENAGRRLFATSFDSNGGLVYRGDAEELRGQMAEQRGDTAGALRAYRNFTELWQDADPELQPRVAAARAALARLEGR